MAEPSRSLQPATLSPTGWCCIDSLNLSNTPESGSPSTSRSRATSMAACMPPHRRGPGPLGEGQRRLVDRAGCRGHRHHRIRRTGSVPWLRQLRSRRAARRGHGARRVPCRQTRRQRLDEVRRRVQQATLGRRGHKDDPLYRIRRTLLTGIEHLTDRQRERLDTYPTATPPARSSWPPNSSTPCTPARSRRSLDSAGQTLRQWRNEILAYHRRGVQRRDRSHQRRHREDPAPGPRLPQLQ